MIAVEFIVYGLPAAWPRTGARVIRGRDGKMHAAIYPASNPAYKTFRTLVRGAAQNELEKRGGTDEYGERNRPFERAVSLTLVFAFPAPKDIRKLVLARSTATLSTGEPVYRPTWKETKPDLDNLAKGVLDALTDAKLWTDDNIVALMALRKIWTNGRPYTAVRVEEIE